jgi:hypothetical protein
MSLAIAAASCLARVAIWVPVFVAFVVVAADVSAVAVASAAGGVVLFAVLLARSSAVKRADLLFLAA